MKREEMLKEVEDVRKDNPYPSDVFVGITEEGMRGKAAKISWDCCCDAIAERLRTQSGSFSLPKENLAKENEDCAFEVCKEKARHGLQGSVNFDGIIINFPVCEKHGMVCHRLEKKDTDATAEMLKEVLKLKKWDCSFERGIVLVPCILVKDIMNLMEVKR